MIISDENGLQIQSLIDAIPDGEVYHNFEDTPQPDFKTLNALPVSCDAGGASVLTPDGQWRILLWDDPSQLQPIPAWWDARILRTNGFEAAQRYPDLEWLLPERPADAVECAECGGDGISPAAKQTGATNVVCKCGGLGWLLAGE